MKSENLIVLAKGSDIGKKAFVVGEIYVGKYIEPKSLVIISDFDHKDEAEKFISTNYSGHSKSSSLNSPSADIYGIWSKGQ
ncbi:hypothetical protein [Bdellovibrio sp. BCCA]|uniref:hypothetical protein n=1 Tax=Bdellovibrio sp. BCCA TaxID=3136281 RepID=UPI0030F0B7C9